MVDSQTFQLCAARGHGGSCGRCTVVMYGDVVVQGVDVGNSGGWK